MIRSKSPTRPSKGHAERRVMALLLGRAPALLQRFVWLEGACGPQVARQSLKDNKCVVIGLQSTGEARTKDAIEEHAGPTTL